VYTAPNNTLYNDYVMRPRSYSRGLRNRKTYANVKYETYLLQFVLHTQLYSPITCSHTLSIARSLTKRQDFASIVHRFTFSAVVVSVGFRLYFVVILMTCVLHVVVRASMTRWMQVSLLKKEILR